MLDGKDTLDFTPIIVGGAMRTGTSLLQNVLSTSPSANDMMVECQYLTAQLSLYVKWRNNPERSLSDFFEDENDFEDYTKSLVVDYLKRTHKQQGNPEHLILKHPEMTPFFPLLAKFLPSARFIVALRDPKDVVASMLAVAERQEKMGRMSNMLQAGRDMQKLTNLFMNFYRGLNRIPNQTPRKLAYIKYETLVTEPESLFPALMEFTGLDLTKYDPTADWIYTRPRSVNKAFDTEIRGKGLSASSIGNYRAALSAEEISVVEMTAKPFMQRFRYAFTNGDIPPTAQ
ncbi:MAG: sulfotransferase [Sneathiella sp.]|nr:sulfotransferase [Sneathiella sp.]